MKRIAALCAMTALVFGTGGCNQAPDTHDADVKAISELEKQWDSDFAGKDPQKLGKYYTDDAVAITEGMPAVVGKAGILEVFKQLMSDPAFALTFHATVPVEVAKSGDMAFTRGVYTMKMTDPSTKGVMTDHGNYVTEYKKQTDGSWKAVTDVVVTEVPAPAAAPSPAPAAKH